MQTAEREWNEGKWPGRIRGRTLNSQRHARRSQTAAEPCLEPCLPVCETRTRLRPAPTPREEVPLSIIHSNVNRKGDKRFTTGSTEPIC